MNIYALWQSYAVAYNAVRQGFVDTAGVAFPLYHSTSICHLTSLWCRLYPSSSGGPCTEFSSNQWASHGFGCPQPDHALHIAISSSFCYLCTVASFKILVQSSHHFFLVFLESYIQFISSEFLVSAQKSPYSGNIRHGRRSQGRGQQGLRCERLYHCSVSTPVLLA